VTIRTQQLNILRPIVCPIPVNMMDSKRNHSRYRMNFCPSALLTATMPLKQPSPNVF